MISYGMDGFVARPLVLLEFEFDIWHEFWMKGVFRIRWVYFAFHVLLAFGFLIFHTYNYYN